MFLLITFNNIMYDIDCETVIFDMYYDRNKPKIGLFFTNI
mgnify:FL=1